MIQAGFFLIKCLHSLPEILNRSILDDVYVISLSLIYPLFSCGLSGVTHRLTPAPLLSRGVYGVTLT